MRMSLSHKDFLQGTMKNKTLTKPFNLFKTGISTDSFTPLSAMLMGASVLLYGTIQVSVQMAFGPQTINPQPLGTCVPDCDVC